MYTAPQCPKCFYHADHIYTIESDKKGTQWAIERCSHCHYAGWPDNPLKYADYLQHRRRKELKADSNFFDDESGRYSK